MTSPHPVACTCIISQRTTKWAEHEAGRLFILYLLSSLSRFLPLSASAVHDDKMKARRSRDRDRECVFMAPSSEIPPFSIIYRLVSLGLGADSFIRWGVGGRGGGSCFDLKIRTIIASGVGKVKESPCVLIRKKSLIFFFFLRRCRKSENIDQGGIEDVLILFPPSVSFGNMGLCVQVVW